MKQSGGFIWVESSPGMGATFEIYLPYSANRGTNSEVENGIISVTGGNETVLLVEDETGVRELASEFLRAGGYAVLEASDGEAALRIAMNHRETIALLLTDMIMPRMNGRDLAQKMLEIRPDIRVVFMTGYSEFPDKSGEKPSGDASILQKPFSRSTLLEKVRDAVSATPPGPLDETKVGGPS